MEQSIDSTTIVYRLDKIEQGLNELKDAVFATKLQEKDIFSLNKKIDKLEKNADETNTRLLILENKPAKEKADKWQYITDYTFRTVVAIVIIGILIKVGMK